MKRMMIGAYDYYNFEYFGRFQHSRVSFLDKIFTQPYQIHTTNNDNWNTIILKRTKFFFLLSFFSRMPSSGKVCISKQMVKICSKVNKSETEEPKPIKVQRKVLEYVCEEASTPLAQQLEQRAKSGEILTLEVINKPVSFSKIEYEPVTCQRQI